MEQEDAIEVWVNAGRDYANIVKYLIDDKFTPETGIGSISVWYRA